MIRSGSLARGERYCPWCAEPISVLAKICKYCLGDVQPESSSQTDSDSTIIEHSQGRVAKLTPAKLATYWLPSFNLYGFVVVFVALLGVCFLTKHFFGFSVTNVSLLLFLPLGPLFLGGILSELFPQRVSGYAARWYITYLGFAFLLYFSDQVIAYLHDGAGVGFSAWYVYLVEHRSMLIKPRGGAPIAVEEVGGLGWVMEAIKISVMSYAIFVAVWEWFKRPPQRR